MNLNIGRKLVMNFGRHIIAIEIYPIQVSPYTLGDKDELLFDIQSILGEKIEIPLGPPIEPKYGWDMNGHMPVNNPYGWITEKEYQNEKLRRNVIDNEP